MPLYWFSTASMTVGVETDEHDAVVITPPILRTFIGQPIDNVRRWLSGQAEFREEKLSGTYKST
jgi:hypothetical protein